MQGKVSHFMARVKELGREEFIEYLKYKYDVMNTITENDRISTGNGEDHLYTWERIYHFSCGNCKNWWSYATSEDSYNWKSRRMTCPHCNHHSTIRPNPEMSKEI